MPFTRNSEGRLSTRNTSRALSVASYSFTRFLRTKPSRNPISQSSYYQDILRGIDRNTPGALLRKVSENISVRDDLTRVFELAIEDPDGNEMRWYQVLTSDTQVTGERQQP